MMKIKKIFSILVMVAFVAIFGILFLNSDLEHIEDTNGPDIYTLQTINDFNIVKMDVGALNLKKSKGLLSDHIEYSSKKFTGVEEIYGANHFGSTLEFTLYHTQVTQGNFKVALVVDDQIVHEFKLNELMQTYRLEKVKGYVALRVAGESANFKLSYSVL